MTTYSLDALRDVYQGFYAAAEGDTWQAYLLSGAAVDELPTDLLWDAHRLADGVARAAKYRDFRVHLLPSGDAVVSEGFSGVRKAVVVPSSCGEVIGFAELMKHAERVLPEELRLRYAVRGSGIAAYLPID